MMKLIAFAAALFMGVTASNVPAFSANDDYDEINLNIRLLQSNVTATGTAEVTGADGEVYRFSGEVTVQMDIPASATAETLMADTEFMGAIKNSLASALGVSVSQLTEVTIELSRRLAEAIARKLAAANVKITYEVTTTSQAAAQALADATATGSAAAFEAGLVSALTTNLASVSSGTYTASGATSAGGSIAAPTTTAAPTAAAAAASPSSSSNANMMKVSFAATFAAIVASIF